MNDTIRIILATLKKDIAMNDRPLDGEYNSGIKRAIEIIEEMYRKGE